VDGGANAGDALQYPVVIAVFIMLFLYPLIKVSSHEFS
jgi:hypothetical protein